MARSRSTLLQSLMWRLEALGFDLFTLLARAAPLDAWSAFGGALFRTLGPLSGAHRTARRNLALAMPDLGEADVARILDQQWDNFGRYMAEFAVSDRLTPASGRVDTSEAGRLVEIARSGRPVVLISGHLSNMEIMAAAILEAGIVCEVTYRAANNPYVDARIREGRRRYGVRLFAPKGAEGARDLLAALKEGRSVAMLNDQRYDAGVAAPFFGHLVMTNPAAVRLALRFGADIQPMSIQRTAGARFKVIAHEPIALRDTGDKSADIEAGVAAVNAFIEARVRERPGEWWWMHRRWPREVYRRDAERSPRGSNGDAG
jgi:Kdo2-lipid IVA lauroyltransferase/acyltransferase